MPMAAPASKIVDGFYQPDYDKTSRLKPLPNPEFHVVPVRGNIYLLVGAGANIAASVGPDGVPIIRDRIKDMKNRGMSLEQVKAAKPTFDYDPIYGRNPGAPDRFVEQVYRSLRD